MISPDQNFLEIDTIINSLKQPHQAEINALYMELGMTTLEKHFTGNLANRSTEIKPATLFTLRQNLSQGLSWLRFPEEPVADLLANTRAVFVDLRPQSGISAVDIQLREFNFGGYSKSGTNRLVVQRVENTTIPSSGAGWNEKTSWRHSLVAITNDEIVAPVIADFGKPNKDVAPGKSFIYEYRDTPVEAPLIVAVPMHENFATHSAGINHPGVTMYCGRVILLVRHNQKESVFVEPSPIPISKPKADAKPRFTIPLS